MKTLVMIAMALMLLTACEKKTEETKTETVTKKVEKKPEEKPPKVEEKATSGQTVGVEAYNVVFTVPEDWKVVRDVSSATATSADGTITAMVVGTESNNMVQIALDNIKEKVQFEDVNLLKSGATVVNGLPGYTAKGTATLVQKSGDKQEIQFLMNSVKVEQKAAALLVFAQAEMYEARKEEIDGMLKTLKKGAN